MSKNLHILISHLNQKEKSSVKKLLKSNKSKSKRTELFNFLNQLDQYDLEKTKEFSLKHNMNYSAESKALFNLILQQLRNSYHKNEYNNRIFIELTNCEILHKSGLDKLLKKRYENLLKLCPSESGLTSIIYKQYTDFMSYNFNQFTTEEIEEHYDIYETALKDMQTASLYTYIVTLARSKIASNYKNYSEYTKYKVSIHKKIDQFNSYKELEADTYIDSTFLNAITNISLGDFENAFLKLKQLKELVESTELDKEHYENNLVTSCANLLKYGLFNPIDISYFDQLKKEIEASKSFYLFFPKRTNRVILEGKLLYYSFFEDIDAGFEFIENNIFPFLNENADNRIETFSILSIINVYCLRYRKPDLAVKYNSRILKNIKPSNRILLAQLLYAFQSKIVSLFDSRFLMLKSKIDNNSSDSVVYQFITDLKNAFYNPKTKIDFYTKYSTIDVSKRNFLRTYFDKFDVIEWALLQKHDCDYYQLKKKDI